MKRPRSAMAAAAGLVAALALTACGGDDGESTSTGVGVAEAQGKPAGELVISNWPLYIDKETIPEFEQATGVSVKYVEDINSYDEFFGKMQPVLANGESAGRSLMVASDALAEKEYTLGYIQRLDQVGARPCARVPEPDRIAGRRPRLTSTRFRGRAG